MAVSSLSPVAQRVWQIVERIPWGSTLSYAELAHLAGTSPRAVGRILHTNTDPGRYPCHRVIHSDGTLASGYAFGGLTVQRHLLEAEGVVFSKEGRVC